MGSNKEFAMKTNKKWALCLGIVAVIAIIGLTFTGCPAEEDPPEIPPLKGSVTIWDEMGPFPNEMLEAKYAAGDETDVSQPLYYWYKAGADGTFKIGVQSDGTAGQSPLGTSDGVTSISNDPTKAFQERLTQTVADGKYKVIAVDFTAIQDWLDLDPSNSIEKLKSVKFIESPVFEVRNPTSDDNLMKKYFGKWRTTTTFQPNGATANVAAHEFVTITYRSFLLDSTWDGTATTLTEQTTAPARQSKEYWDFRINGWKKNTGNPPATPYNTYTNGWTLSGSRIATNGYGGSAIPFNVWQSDTNATLFIRTSTSNAAIPRTYTKQN